MHSEEKLRADPALVEAINQIFALFRLNYHNQYYAAYSEAEQLRQVKKLWLESLSAFPPSQLLQGARLAIESSEYLPTLHRMRTCCEDSLPELGLPSPRDAYLEACNCSSPAEAVTWSHAAVYWAGRDCGWTRLASAPETQTWDDFRTAYQARCAVVLGGEPLPPVPEPQSTSLPVKALEREAALAEIRKLRTANDL